MRVSRLALKCLSTCLAIGLGATVAHAGDKYSCTFDNVAPRSPVPEAMTLDVRSDQWVAFVQDDYTKQVSTRPVSATIDSFSSKKLRLKWQLVGLSYQGTETWISSGVVDYKLTVFTKTNKAILTGATREYYSRLYAEGTCTKK